ncbi:MAG: hypothetical protein ACRERD_15290 [Candidatus Binatia bacterium]
MLEHRPVLIVPETLQKVAAPSRSTLPSSPRLPCCVLILALPWIEEPSDVRLLVVALPERPHQPRPVLPRDRVRRSAR